MSGLGNGSKYTLRRSSILKRNTTTKYSPKKFNFNYKHQEQLRPKHIPKSTWDKISPSGRTKTLESTVKRLKLRDLTPKQQSEYKNFAERKQKRLDLARHRTNNIHNYSSSPDTFREFKNNIFGFNIPNHNVGRVKKRIRKAKSDKQDNDLFGTDIDFNFF